MAPRLLPALFTALIFGGCDTPLPPGDISTDEPIGTLQYAIGEDVREIPYGDVRCTPDGDAVMVELVSHRVVRGPQGVGQRPRVLVARIRGDEVLEAHAFAYGVVHEGTHYTMLQMVAKEIVGAQRAQCRIEAEDGFTTLVCNRTNIVGWQAAGPPPRPSFKARWKACG